MHWLITFLLSIAGLHEGFNKLWIVFINNNTVQGGYNICEVVIASVLFPILSACWGLACSLHKAKGGRFFKQINI